MPTIQDLVDGIRQACSISCREEDEAEPYKNKYQAADLLKRLLGERALSGEEPAPNADSKPSSVASPSDEQAAVLRSTETVSSSSGVHVPSHPSEAELAVAAARIRCGLILLETDLLSDGKSSIEAGLPFLEKSPESYLAWLLESYNALGALHSELSDMPVALQWLERAEDLYQRTTGTGTKHAHLAPLIAGAAVTTAPAAGGNNGGSSSSNNNDNGSCTGGRSSVSKWGEVSAEQQHQPQPQSQQPTEPQKQQQQQEPGGGQEGKASGSGEARGGGGGGGLVASAPSAVAVEAAATSEAEALHVQLPGNDADAVQSQYTHTLFYLAQVYGHMKVSDRSALYCAATLYRQLASGKYDLDTWVNNCLQLGGYYAKVHAYGMAMYCHAAAQAVVDRDTAVGAVLGEDIAANFKLATARVYSMRLAASYDKYVERKELDVHYPDISYFPDYLRFSGLTVPSPDSFPWGEAALATNFEAARELLNSGIPYFKAALSYYQLDGWVTDHVGIIMDMSNMYRCLAGFESDSARVVAMHRCRAQMLEPLSGALSPDHYPGLSRSIDLELAHVYREISDVRQLQGGQLAKVAAAAAAAAKYYQRFLQSFVSSETGSLPDRVDPENERYFLMASFGLGRMLQRMKGQAPPPPTVSGSGTGSGTGRGQGAAPQPEARFESLLIAAHKHLQWTSGYVKRHGLESWMQEAQAAEELSELLVEQMRLRAIKATAAAARSGTS